MIQVSLNVTSKTYLDLHLIMALRKKNVIVKLTYFGAEFETECATFRPAFTDLTHALVVVCDMTQILPPVSASSHRQPPMRE